MKDLDLYTEKALDWVMAFAPKLVMAIVVLIIGLWIVNKLSALIEAFLKKSPLTPEVNSFLASLSSIALKVILFFSAAGIVGIELTSFVAILAAAGFAVGMALQGSLGNFAAGIIILVFKPYRVGDWVEVQGKFGKVTDVQIFNTIVETPGQNLLIIPNGKVIDDVVTNYSSRGFVRIELEVTIPYSESFPRVEGIIRQALSVETLILKDPELEIGILDFDSHSIVVSVRPYCLPDDYWDVRFKANALIKKAFSDNDIQVAYSEGVELGKIGE
jgi:small conductance mechanosensitive channel